MDAHGHTHRLTHQDCLELVGHPPHSRTAQIAVDGAEPVVLACFVRDTGDVLVPTGNDPSLTRSATGRPVLVEITDKHGGWTITGVGLARPLGHRDRPAFDAGLDTLAMRYAFDNGILVRIARLTGHRAAGAPPIPAQRTDSPSPASGELKARS